MCQGIHLWIMLGITVLQFNFPSQQLSIWKLTSRKSIYISVRRKLMGPPARIDNCKLILLYNVSKNHHEQKWIPSKDSIMALGIGWMSCVIQCFPNKEYWCKIGSLLSTHRCHKIYVFFTTWLRTPKQKRSPHCNFPHLVQMWSFMGHPEFYWVVVGL